MACIEIEVKRLAGPEADRTLRWVSADGQGEYTGWEIPAGEDDIDAVSECLAEILSQCGEEADIRGILSGHLEISAAE